MSKSAPPPLMDALDLKDLIRVQREQLNKAKDDRDDLTKEIETIVKIAANAKNKLNIAQQKSIVLPLDSVIQYDEKFLEADAKLDMKLLIEDLKKILPNLEQEALQMEMQLHSMEMNTKKATSNAEVIPIHFKRSVDDIAKELNDVKQELNHSYESIQNSTKSKSTLQSDLHRKLQTLQRSRDTLLEEKALMQETRDLYEVAYSAEEDRLVRLEDMHASLLHVLDKT